MTTKHTHRMIRARRETRGFGFCARPERCNPSAHGYVTHVDYCACGATRRTNENGSRYECGPWIEA